MVTARPISRSDARRNYDRLICAAQDVLREDGTDATLDEIARRAGVGIATLYRHFGTREDLYLAAMAETFHQLHDSAQTLLEHDSADEALAIWLDKFIQCQLRFRGVANYVEVACQERWCAEKPALVEQIRGDGEALFERAQREGSFRSNLHWNDAIEIIKGSVHMALLDDDPLQRARQLIKIVTDGMRTSESR